MIITDNHDLITAEQIESEICLLRQRLAAIKRQEIKEHKERSAVHVGRCFRTSDGRYVIVANVPQECETMTGVDYNPYQFPAIWLIDALIPFDLDMVFSEILEMGESALLLTRFVEIAPEEFLTAFEERVQRLRSIVARLIANREKHEGGQGGGLATAPCQHSILL